MAPTKLKLLLTCLTISCCSVVVFVAITSFTTTNRTVKTVETGKDARGVNLLELTLGQGAYHGPLQTVSTRPSLRKVQHSLNSSLSEITISPVHSTTDTHNSEVNHSSRTVFAAHSTHIHTDFTALSRSPHNGQVEERRKKALALRIAKSHAAKPKDEHRQNKTVCINGICRLQRPYYDSNTKARAAAALAAHWSQEHTTDLPYPLPQIETKLVCENSTCSSKITNPASIYRNGRCYYQDSSRVAHLNSGSPAKRTWAPCQDDICYEYLSPCEKVQFDVCLNKTRAAETKFGPIRSGSCQFMNTTDLFPVALASYAGSGNTWVRGLLEEATGICTGAIYCDGGLKTGGFNGEGVRGPSTLVIKTHAAAPRYPTRRLRTDLLLYRAAIVLVRNPGNALVAEWNRERTKTLISNSSSNHYLYVGEEHFGDNTDWQKYLDFKGPRWVLQLQGWLRYAKERPTLIVRYEDLKTDTVSQVKRMLDFLEFPYEEEDLRKRLTEGYSNFYRNHTASFEHFTAKQRLFVNGLVDQAGEMLSQYGITDLLKIDDYYMKS